MNIKVKICGITRVEDALAAIDSGADMIGINFYARSPRSVSMERAWEIREAVPEAHKVVGVFVNAAREFIMDCLEQMRLDLLQFHGDEPDSFLEGWRVPVIRARRLKLRARHFNLPGPQHLYIRCSIPFIRDSTAGPARNARCPIFAVSI